MHQYNPIYLIAIVCIIFLVNATSPLAVDVYDFGASWCGPCRRDIARDKELQQAYGGKVTFYFVDEDVDRAKGEEFIKATGAAPTLKVEFDDASHSKAIGMGAAGSTPSLVIKGKTTEVIHGSIDIEALRAKIDAQLGR